MDKESSNWFRYAKLLINTGSEVLRTFFNLEVQTLCFSSYRSFWLKKAQESDPRNFIALWWTKLNRQLTRLDSDSQKVFNKISPLKLNDRKIKMPLLQQIQEISEWYTYIQLHIKQLSSAPDRNKMSIFANDMLDEISKLNALHNVQSNWTRKFFELVNKYCIGLRGNLNKIHDDHDDFIFSCQDNLCKSQEHLISIIASSKSKVQTMRQNWSQETQEYFNLWKEEVRILLDSFKHEKHNIAYNDALQMFLDDVTKDLPVEHVSRMDIMKQTDCSWNENMEKLLKRWQTEISVYIDKALDLKNLITSWSAELSAQHSSDSYQLRNFFHSAFVQSELRNLRDHEILKEHQFSKLSSTQDIPDINEFDINILIILLRNTCHVCPPDFGWCDPVVKLDLSVGADLMRIRSCRSEYIAHIANTYIPDSTFDKLWITLECVLCRLASYCGDRFQDKIRKDIENLKLCHLEPQQEILFKSQVITFCKNAILVEISDISLSGSVTELERFREMYQSVKIAEQAFYQDNTIEALQPQIRDGLNKLSTMRQEIQVLDTHKNDIEAKNNFSYVFEEFQQRKVNTKPKQFVTNCFVCYFVCHADCSIPDDSGKERFVTMKDGYCTTCVGKCHWTKHRNRSFYFETYVENKKGTYESLKAKYAPIRAETKKQQSVEEAIKSQVDSESQNVMSMIKVVRKSVNNSEEGTRTKNPYNDANHLEHMINSESAERTAGWTYRVQILEEMREKALLMHQKPNSDSDLQLCLIS